MEEETLRRRPLTEAAATSHTGGCPSPATHLPGPLRSTTAKERTLQGPFMSPLTE